MDLPTIAITAYCERTNDSFWAEPLNAITNFAFIVVAIDLMRRLQQRRTSFAANFDIYLLIILIGAVGIGSFLWHTYATTWAEFLDVIPILLYMGVFLLSFLRRIVRLSITASIMWLLIFYAVNFAVYILIPADAMNGSIFYMPGVVVLAFISRYDHRLRIPAILFIIGVVFRSIDRLICPTIPIGSHFLWHLSISLVVFFTTKIFIAEGNRIKSVSLHQP